MKKFLVQKKLNGVYRNYASFQNIEDAILVCKLIKENCQIYDREQKKHISIVPNKK